MFVCSYCQACLGTYTSINQLKEVLNGWCEHKNRPYHIKCVAYHTNRLCSVCREPQFKTNSGWVCSNGHGGAPALEGTECRDG